MSRAHLHRPVTDSEGNVVPNTQVAVYEAGTTQLLLQPIYSDKVSTVTTVQNPWTTSDGFIDFYLDKPQSVKIGLTVQGSTETFTDDISVLPPPENMVQAQVGFQIVNAPVPGQFLQSGQPGVAAWVDAGDIVNSKPTPLLAVKTYDWSGGVLDDATLLDASGQPITPVYADVTADTKPVGWTFTGALQLPTTGPITLTSPPQTFPETGTAIFLFKVISANQGVDAAVLRIAIDDTLIYVETPTVADLCNTWLVGYIDEIPSGSHKISITQKPGADGTSSVLIGPVWMQFGNNIPAHDHPGGGTDSVKLGPSALADFAGSTSVGSNAKALDQNATSFGFNAQAGLNGLALGASAYAPQDSVAVGHRSSVLAGKIGGVSIGKDAAVSDDAGVAVGVRARAQGASSIAAGPDAKTGTVAEAIAVGSAAQALATRSIAIGQGATVAVGHDYSVAIGAGVATTAAHQAMIGDSQTTIVIPGSLKTTGGDAQFGGPTSKLGFYGAPGIAKPTVLGSRGGNATLAQLLTLLANMGLITDGTST